jgi:hypothetical protein
MEPRNRSTLRRILQDSGTPQIIEALTEKLSPTDLQSLLLEVYRIRSSHRGAPELLTQYLHNRFVALANASPVETAKLDLLAYELLPKGFLPVELSPLSPLGTSSVLGPVDQNNVVSTARNTEVLSDPTNVMALECAKRRSAHPWELVKLCCSQRLVRAQSIEGSATFAHFRMLSLCTAGRDTGNHRFEEEAVVEHIDFYIRLLLAARDVGFTVGRIRVKLITYGDSLRKVTAESIQPRLTEKHTAVSFETENAPDPDAAYYQGIRFNLHAEDPTGEARFLVDGGITDWTQKLLSNLKERLMTSGMGTERFLVCFGQASGDKASM